MSNPDDGARAPQTELAQLVFGFYVSQAISVAARLGIADVLAAGPLVVDELAPKVGASPAALYRLLRALASVGVFVEDDRRQFGLTPLAERLRSDVPGSYRAMALLPTEPSFWGPWNELLYSVQTGKTAFRKLYGMDVWEWREKEPEAGRVFNEAMASNSEGHAEAILRAYDFSGFGHVLDVGGGHGALAAAICKANPDVRATVFDLAFVAEGARAFLGAQGLDRRCDVAAGDMFETIPAGADAYVFKYIIHDWDDERTLQLLRTCRKAMDRAAGSLEPRLLVIESVIPTGNGPHPGKLLDLQMLVSAGGRERTAEEFATLYRAAGFRLTRVVPTNCPLSVVEGVPV